MSGFFKFRDFFIKSVLRKTAEFSVSDTGDLLILTCLVKGSIFTDKKCGGMDGMDGRRQNYIPPTKSGDKKR